MLKKLLMFAITSGLAAKLYKRYVEKQDQQASRTPAKPATGPQRKRPAQKKQA
jgi:membrane protein implicated in regulation of membrane protease activity